MPQSRPPGARRDPLAIVFNALETAGCNPRGEVHRFTAHCPVEGHNDRSPSLSVAEGCDGRALVHCFAGDSTRDVVAALGLSWSDLFPPGHRSARRTPGLAPPRPPLDVILTAVLESGRTYRVATSGALWVIDECPGCGEGSCWVAAPTSREVRLTCFGGCAQEHILDALAGVSP